MAEIFKDNRLVIASNNTGKVSEISKLLAPYNIIILKAGDFPYPEPVETGSSFIENAEIKSRYYANHTGYTALSDDSGLEVDALNGAPGVYSADWAGSPRDFNAAMQRVESELNAKGLKTRNPADSDIEKLKANFMCMLSLCTADGKTHNFAGKVFGHLQFPPKGDNGFGYDAIFVPQGYRQTFAELPAETKHNISHRADAFNKFRHFIDTAA